MELLAIQTRGGRPERRHHGDAVVLAADGRVLQAWGDPEAATYWRSAAKPVQAAVVVATGAWDAYGLDDEALAVACGSHAGEPGHCQQVARILAALEFGPADLRCGVHRPWSRHSVRPAAGPDTLCNNCSGKHAAMLAACLHMAWPPDYLAPGHPLHQAFRVRAGLPPDAWAVDGCGVPTYWGTIAALARSFQGLGGDDAGRRVLDAMGKHPWMVSGTDQFCTDLGSATGGLVVGKYGALGVYAALHRPTGQALALKVADGDEGSAKATAGRIMEQMGWLPGAAAEALAGHVERPNRNHAGLVVGNLRSVF